MPQMSPMNWTFLFMTFLLTLLMVAIKLYFNTSYKPINSETTLTQVTLTINGKHWSW